MTWPKVAFALLGLIGVMVITIVLAMQGSAAPSAVTTYTNSTYGFQVSLPDGWRRSLVLSNTQGLESTRPTSRLLAWDVFTARSEAEEATAATQGNVETFPRSWQYVVEVEVWSNPLGLTPLEYASDANLAGWAHGQVIDSITLGGRTVARQTGGAVHAVSYYVAVRSYMFRVGHHNGDGVSRPPAASDTALQSIAQSMRAP